MFFISAASFGTLSLWGYTTQRDLTGMGSFLIMGLFGLIIAMLVDVFLQSTAPRLGAVGHRRADLHWAHRVGYQKIKEYYDPMDDGTIAGRKVVMGALALYLDFINLFLMLLRLFGDRRWWLTATLLGAIRSPDGTSCGSAATWRIRNLPVHFVVRSVFTALV